MTRNSFARQRQIFFRVLAQISRTSLTLTSCAPSATGSPSWSRQFPPVVQGKVAIYASGSGEYAAQGTEKFFTFSGTPEPAKDGREVMSFIYSNDNADGSEHLLRLLADQDILTYIENRIGKDSHSDGHLRYSPQVKAYGHALHLLPELWEHEWALFVDGDELLIPDERFDFKAGRVIDAAIERFPARPPSALRPSARYRDRSKLALAPSEPGCSPVSVSPLAGARCDRGHRPAAPWLAGPCQ